MNEFIGWGIFVAVVSFVLGYAFGWGIRDNQARSERDYRIAQLEDQIASLQAYLRQER